MIQYPKIATLKFSNKEVNCKFVLRAKLFEMELYHHDPNAKNTFIETENGIEKEYNCPFRRRGQTATVLKNIPESWKLNYNEQLTNGDDMNEEV